MYRVTMFLRTKENYSREEYKSILQEIHDFLAPKNISVSDIFCVETSEEVEKQAKKNIDDFTEFKTKLDKAIEYSGITEEQAYKFMDGFNK